MSTQAVVIPVLGLLIPDFDTARSIVRDLDEKQYRKWTEDSAVELKLESVYVLKSTAEAGVDYAAVLVDRTVTPEIEEVPLVDIAEVSVRVDSNGKRLDTAFLVLDWRPPNAYPHIMLDAILWRLGIYRTQSSELELRPDVEELTEQLRSERRAVVEVEDMEGDLPRSFRLEIEVKRVFQGWALMPEHVYLLKLQYVSIPRDVLPEEAQFRSSFHRCGWLGKITNIDVGFEGHLYVALMPMHPFSPVLVLEKGCRIAQMRLKKLAAELRGYSGQWRQM